MEILVIYWICDGIYWNQCMQGYYERPWNYTDIIFLDIICLYVILLEINNMGSSFDVEFLYIIPANEISKTLICEG